MTLSELTKRIFSTPAIHELSQSLSGVAAGIHRISPLTGSLKSIFTLRLCANDRNIVLLFQNARDVQETEVELKLLGTQTKIISVIDFHPESLLEKLNDLNLSDSFILLSTFSILTAQIPKRELINQNTIIINASVGVDYQALVDQLRSFGYMLDQFVQNPGDFSQRGAIIDFWSYGEKYPVRIEFFGDDIESIRFFDADTQRSFETIPSVSLSAPMPEDASEILYSDIFDYLKNPVFIFSEYDFTATLLNDIPPLDQEEPISEIELSDLDEEYKDILGLTGIKLKTPAASITAENIFKRRNVRFILEQELASASKESLSLHSGVLSLNMVSAPSVNGQYSLLNDELKKAAANGFNCIITTESDFHTNRLTNLLTEYKETLSDLFDEGKLSVITLPLREGFVSKDLKMLIITDYQIFGKPYRSKLPPKRPKKSKSKEIAALKYGDYVVHELYGIGQYTGLETIRIGDIDQESMKLLYRDEGVVYVNLNYLHLVTKYSSEEGLKPELSSLSSPEWQKTKQKAKKKILELAHDLIQLYAQRKATQGFAFGADTIWQKELEASFMYEDTVDQARISSEVKEDMELQNPMDRLICGDVGFGKTEIAVRAAFKAAQESKQVSVLVPTTILAEQHYNTFKDRLAQFPVTVEMLSRFRSKAEQKEILQKLKKGEVDIVIGTHRLLSKDVEFHDLGLLVIDEEHRFGVMAKEKLRKIRASVDTIAMTATPIPRTLNLSLLGARDLSLLTTPPPNRQPIFSQVEVFNITKIRQWIQFELLRKGQIFFVHDRIHSIHKLAEIIQKHVPGVRIGVAHGQMRPEKLEDVIHEFLTKKTDILLCTKIIESGIDIPNVNTIIINRADRFGLAELHQLRGRVGRSDRQAYAYFIVPPLHLLKKNTLQKLRAIEELSELGSGFQLAMRDLEIRGAGNLLGTEQSGFIQDVGFDLYIKMIDEAVEELRQTEFKEVFKTLPKQVERTNTVIDTYFEIGIPHSYIDHPANRLNFYKAVLAAGKQEDLEDIKEELIDRFGTIPSQVHQLLQTAELKMNASYALFDRIIIQKKQIIFVLPKGEKEDYYETKFKLLLTHIVKKYKERIRFNHQKSDLKLTMNNTFTETDNLFSFLITFCKEVAGLYSGS